MATSSNSTPESAGRRCSAGAEIEGKMLPVVETSQREHVLTGKGDRPYPGHRRVVEDEPLPLPGGRFDAEKEAERDRVGTSVGDDDDPTRLAGELPEMSLVRVRADTPFGQQVRHRSGDALMECPETLTAGDSVPPFFGRPVHALGEDALDGRFWGPGPVGHLDLDEILDGDRFDAGEFGDGCGGLLGSCRRRDEDLPDRNAFGDETFCSKERLPVPEFGEVRIHLRHAVDRPARLSMADEEQFHQQEVTVRVPGRHIRLVCNSEGMQHRIVVIGAGLGGLSAAAYLAQAGHHVTVLEHHSVPGGYAHEFRRRGYRFEVALHALDGAGPGGWIHPILRELGVLDRVTINALDPLYVARFPDFEVVAHADLAEYRAELVGMFPAEEEGLDALLAYMREVARDVSRYQQDRSAGVRVPMVEMPQHYPAMATAFASTWAEVMDAHLTDPQLKAVLSALWGYLGLPPSLLSGGLYTMAWMSYHLGGAYYPVGGSQALSRAIEASIVEHGGEVRYRQTVERLEIDGGRIVAVETDRGLKIPADLVVSNASPADTIRMAGPEHFPAEFAESVQGERPALSTLTLYLGLKVDVAARGWPHHEFFLAEGYDVDAEYRAVLDGDFDRVGMVIANYTHSDPGCAPDGGSVMAVTALAPWNYENVWGTGGVIDGYRRNPEYRRVKQEAAERLLVRVEKLIPGLRESIEVIEVATPLTNYRYGLSPHGSIYGREQTVENMLLRRKPTTAIPNLLLAGAWVSGGGMSSAIGSGRTAAAIALSRLG